MDPSQTAAEGQNAAEDWGRFNAGGLGADFTAAEAAQPGSAAFTSALDALQQVASQQMPSIPVLYGAAWYEYSTQYFTGFPTQANPYVNPSPNYQAYLYLVLNLKPVTS